ncbi:MAG: DNA-binding domain-containing protein [Mangrovibacterium sp.]
MALTYGLYPNSVFKEEQVFRALIKERQKYTLDEVVVRMVRRSPALTAAAIRGTLDLFMEEVSQILEDGDSVTTPLFKAQCSISGKFTGANDYFQTNRHQVKVNLRPGSLLNKMAKQVRPHKGEGHLPRPLIKSFTDMSTGGTDSALTPGGPAVIRGIRLKFDPDDTEQGVFLENESGKLLRIPGVLRNVFSQIILMVPADLLPGTYRLIVKSKLNTQQLRTSEFSHLLVAG